MRLLALDLLSFLLSAAKQAAHHEEESSALPIWAKDINKKLTCRTTVVRLGGCVRGMPGLRCMAPALGRIRSYLSSDRVLHFDGMCAANSMAMIVVVCVPSNS